jgi:hypothetical protein
MSQSQRSLFTPTHHLDRVDVRTKSYELGRRGGVAVVSSVHERSPAFLGIPTRAVSHAHQTPKAPQTRTGRTKSSS